MAVYFAESSALCKRYVAEVGSVWLRASIDPANGCTVLIVRITAVEIIAAITRRERTGSVTPTDAVTARSAFELDLGSEFQVVEVSEAVVSTAMRMAERYGLRAYDAVQLAAALQVNAQFIARGKSPISVLSADTDLNAAAQAEGLVVEDPNAYP